MSEPAWYAECRALYAAGGITKAELAKRFNRKQTTIQRALNGNSTQWNAKTNRGHNPRAAEAMRKRWSDPEWANKQRLKISEGLLNSTRQIGRPRNDSLWADPHEARQPWKPGDPKPQFLKRASA